AIANGDGNMTWVSVQDTATVVGISPELKVTAQYKLNGSQPAGLVYDPNFHRIYVAVRSAVIALDADHGNEVARVAAPAGVETLTLDAAGHTLFAAGGGSIVSMSTGGGLREVDELLADVKGHNILFDPNGKLLFLPGGREGRSKMLIVKDLSQPGAQSPAETD